MTDAELRDEIKRLSNRIIFLKSNKRTVLANKAQKRLDRLQLERESLNTE